MTKLFLERHQLSQLADKPALYREISQQLIDLEDEFSYVLNQAYRFKLRHDHNGDYFHFFKYLADGKAENVFALLFRNAAGELVGCCQIVFQIKGEAVWAYFCDLKVKKAYRRRALKQLAWYVLHDTFFNQNKSLLNHYCALQAACKPSETVDIKMYFVNMGGQAVSQNGLLRICRHFALLFQCVKFLLRQKVSLRVHIKRGYIASDNSADLAHTVPSCKKIILFNQQFDEIGQLDLHHADVHRPIVDNPEVDYRQTVLMGLSEMPTNQAFTMFFTHENGEAIGVQDILPHTGWI